jgi:hypothetical protein
MNTGTSLRLRTADEARHIIDSVQQTDYQHNIHIVAAEGIYDCDCSGFLEYVLSRVAPQHLKQIPLSPGETRPLAHDFAKFFRSRPLETAEGWRQIRHLHDARRGDLIAWAPAHFICRSTRPGHLSLFSSAQKTRWSPITRLPSRASSSSTYELTINCCQVARRNRMPRTSRGGAPYALLQRDMIRVISLRETVTGDSFAGQGLRVARGAAAQPERSAPPAGSVNGAGIHRHRLLVGAPAH